MATTTQTFDNGTAGATLTTVTSGGGGNTAFNFVNSPTNGFIRYTTTAYRGGMAVEFGTTSSAVTAFAEVSTTLGVVSSGQVYGRLRFMLPTLPVDATGVRVMVFVDSTGAFLCDIRVNNAGKVSLRNAAGTAIYTSTLTITAGQWVDCGMAILAFSSTVGQTRFIIYDSVGGTAELFTSTANLNTLGAGGANRFQVGMVRSITNQTVVIDDVYFDTAGFPSVPSATNPSVTAGPLSGATGDSGFTVAYVLADTTSARLVYSTASNLSSPSYSSSAAPGARGAVKFALTGLAADTVYYLGIEADGTLLATGRGQTRTDPVQGSQASHSWAFGSCNWDAPTGPSFAYAAAYAGPYGQPRRLAHQGDMGYPDWTGSATLALVFAWMRAQVASVSLAAAFTVMAHTYNPDNHDWGGDVSDKTAAAGPLVAAAFRELFPHYTLPAADGIGMWYSYVIGRVRYIHLDPRSQRDPQGDPNSPTKTMLGVAQKAWFKAQLLMGEPLKVVAGSYPWRSGTPGDGRWGSYPDEFAELTTFMQTNPVGFPYFTAGDRHYLAADDGSTPDTQGFPSVVGAPFQQSSVATGETWSQGFYNGGAAGVTLTAVGLLDIADTGTAITITYTGKTTNDGVTRVSMVTVVDLSADVSPAGVGSGAAVGSPAVTTGPVGVSPAGIGTGAVVGTPALVAGPVGVSPAGVASGAAVGSPAVTVGAVAVAPAGVPTGAAVGTPTITAGPVEVRPVGIASSEDVGAPTVAAAGSVVAPGGIGSGEAVGSPTVTVGAVVVSPGGIAGAGAVGSPAVTLGPGGQQVISPTGIPSGAAVGSPTVGDAQAQQISPAGIPSALAVGRPMLARMAVKEQPMAPCLWDIDTGCNPEWQAYPPEVQSRATRWATEILWMLSGRRFGTCPVTVRPCQGCGERTWQTFGVLAQGGSEGGWVPYLRDGQWSNCGCAGAHACHPDSEVWLPGPVASVIEVRVGAEVVPDDAYRVDDGNWLVRHDGGEWPRTQNLSLRPGSAGTFTVTYLRGVPVPDAGKVAAGALAVEFARACASAGACRLPREAQSIIRQGIELQLVPDDPGDMLTGVTEADQWLRAVNPHKLRQRPLVASLDLTAPRVTTWG